MVKKTNNKQIKKSKLNKKSISIFVVILIVILGLVFTTIILPHKKEEDFYRKYNLANEDYKKVLFATGQNDSKSIELMRNYENSFLELKSNMKTPISDFKNDADLKKSISFIENQMYLAREQINSDNLHQAHLELEEVRKEWLDVFERNNVGVLGMYMTQFHDIMELAAEHDFKNTNYIELEKVCIDLNQSWSTVETTKVDLTGDKLVDFNSKVKLERENIENFCNGVLAKNDNLDDLSSKLKKDFISVYLKYG